MPEIKVMPDPAALAAEGAERFVNVAREAIAERGQFAVALAGGHTPEAMFRLLAQEPYRSRVEWEKVQAFFGDERFVPPDSDQSNYRMARETLLSHVPVPGDNVYRIRGEIDPNEAAIEYGQMLKDKFGDGGLDLILLGMGPDGHTASLFPGTEALHETKHRAVANFVPKLNTWRVTLTAPFINRARHVLFLVAGADKAERVSEILEGPRDPERLPSQLIQPVDGTLTWILDAAAAGMGR
ncbi:MAG TPA: 6-phosphogluconolactonase [Tepidisphaeraceae bacterium]